MYKIRYPLQDVLQMAPNKKINTQQILAKIMTSLALTSSDRSLNTRQKEILHLLCDTDATCQLLIRNKGRLID